MKGLKRIISFTVFLLCILNTALAEDKAKIAVIVPTEHQAMDDIVRGLQVGLSDMMQSEQIVILNAMGDLNNLNSIINQVVNQDFKVILPIGTLSTYLTIAATEDKPIIGLASTINEKTRQNLIRDNHLNVTNVTDEISSHTLLKFISNLKRNRVLLVYSSSDERISKTVKEIEDIKSYYNINLRKFPIVSTIDMYSIKSAIQDVDCILILKDHLIVSMISVLIEVAHEKLVPVIASDEGSVKSGADVGIGISEYDIGFEGAKLVKEILHGKKISDIKVKEIKNVQVFYNQQNINNKIDISEIQSAAEEFKYNTISVEK